MECAIGHLHDNGTWEDFKVAAIDGPQPRIATIRLVLCQKSLLSPLSDYLEKPLQQHNPQHLGTTYVLGERISGSFWL